MILDAVFNEQGLELSANFENKVELNYIIAQSVTERKEYAVSASSVDAPTSWGSEAPTPTNATPYLWMKTLTSYVAVDGSVFNFEDGGVVVGVRGSDGYTPIKGKDYFTEADIQSVLGLATPERIGARPNTWLPTIAEIGAAPAGFGLGMERPNVLTTKAQVNALRAFGLHEYYSSESACDGIDGITQGSILTIPTMYAVTQYFFCRYPHLGCYLKRVSSLTVGDGWDSWEWVNPPMVPGVEYRTTERYNGKPVYVKYTGDMGGLSASLYSSFSFYSSGVIDSLVSCEGNVWNDTSGTKWNFPFIYSDGANQFALCGANADGGIYVLSPGGGLSSYTHCAFVVKYTKRDD